jgi:hypothetical protein
VTKGALKNLITDKPAPLTNNVIEGTANLVQKGKTGVPITVNPVVRKNEVADAKLDLNMTVGDDKVVLHQQTTKLAQGVPVLVDPILLKNTMASEKFGNHILVGSDEIEYNKKSMKLAQVANPTENPPYNNWSVNQPSPYHSQGYAGKEDYGQNILVDGHHVRY